MFEEKFLKFPVILDNRINLVDYFVKNCYPFFICKPKFLNEMIQVRATIFFVFLQFLALFLALF